MGTYWEEEKETESRSGVEKSKFKEERGSLISIFQGKTVFKKIEKSIKKSVPEVVETVFCVCEQKGGGPIKRGRSLG